MDPLAGDAPTSLPPSRVLAPRGEQPDGRLSRLAAALRQIPSAEIRLWIPLRHPVAFGDKVATVRDDHPEDARRLADEIRGAVLTLHSDSWTGPAGDEAST